MHDTQEHAGHNTCLSRRQPRCKALGCGCDLSTCKLYCQRKHLCEKHLQEEYVQLPRDSQLYRFCFQCGKLETLDRFDANKRTCRMRLAKRRNNPNNNKKQRTPTNSSRCTSSASDEPLSDAAAGVDTAADAAATPASGSRDLSGPCNLASFGDVWAQNALPAQDAYMQGCSANATEQEQQLPSSPMTKVSSDSSGSSTQHCSRGVPGLAPISTAVSAGDTAVPQLAGAGGMAVEVNLMLSSFDLTASSAASCGGAAAVLAGASGFNAYTPPHLEHALQGVDDAESLQLMLESELIAAALGAAIASRGSAALNTESREASQKLAAVLVQDSGLSIEASDRELSTAVPAPVAAAQLTCAPLDKSSMALQAHAMCKQDSMIGSCLSTVGSVSHMAFAPPAGAVATPWGCHSASIALGAPKVLGTAGNVMMAAPSCSSNCMSALAASAVAWPPQLPALGALPPYSQTPCFPGVGAQLPSMLLGASGLSTGTPVAGEQAAVGQVERLQELRQQMVQLQCRLQDLRWHLGLCGWAGVSI